MKIDELIDEISSGVKPVRTMLSTRVLFLLSTILFVLWMGSILVLHGIRGDIFAKVQGPAFWLQMVIPAATALFALLLTLKLRSPAYMPRSSLKVILLGSFATLLAIACHGLLFEGADGHSFNAIRELKCLAIMLVLMSIPTFAAWKSLQEGAPTAPKTASSLAVLSSGFLSLALLPLSCPVDELTHVFVGHLSPVVLMTGVFWQIGRRLLRW